MIAIETLVHAPLATAWDCWTLPEHITQWCQASEDWHAPRAENDLRPGGRFCTVMAAKDGSFSFDFAGTYTAVEPLRHIAYTLDDGRRVQIDFSADEDGRTRVVQHFEPESENPEDMQRSGWQAILDSFAAYTARHAA